MPVWRNFGAVIVLLAARAGGAETYPLAETSQAGDCSRVTLEMNLAGELRVNREGKTVPIKLLAKADHEFVERVLAPTAGGLPAKAARVYDKALAVVATPGDKSERSLRADRKLLVAQRDKDQLLVYSPGGPLTREELEVAGEHFDTSMLAGLLPGKDVAVGDTWKLANSAAQALCHFEGLAEHDLTGKLEEVKDNVARFTVSGKASGIDLGALAKLQVEATARFDLAQKRVVALEWKQQDERDQGPASPAGAMTTTVVMKRSAIDRPAALADVALVSVPDGEAPAGLTALQAREPKGRYELLYGREWHVVSQTERHLVMRLVEQGDFIAQATITPWTRAEKGKHLSPDEFKEAMNRTPGWEPEKELQAGEVPSSGVWTYRVSALGQMDGTPVMQNFYLVASPEGEQVVLVFTMTPKQAEKLGSRDLSLAGSLEFPAKK